MSDKPERIRVWPDVNDHFNPARPDWTGGYWNTDGTALSADADIVEIVA